MARLEQMVADRLELLDRYAGELRSLIFEKTKLDMPCFPMQLCVSEQETMFLERFIACNRLGDTKKIWRKYQKRYDGISKEISETMANLYKNGRPNKLRRRQA